MGKKALVIAVSEYGPSLRNMPACENDGWEMHEILVSQGYDVPDRWRLIGSVSGSEMRNAIHDFFVKNATANDTLFFYFSGHGQICGETHYLTNTDFDDDVPDQDGFKFEDLAAVIESSKAHDVIAILDCCFSGAMRMHGRSVAKWKIAKVKIKRVFRDVFKEDSGRCIMASSLGIQESYDTPKQEHGKFTYSMLRGLSGRDADAADKEQPPIVKTEMSKDFTIAKYPILGLQTKLLD